MANQPFDTTIINPLERPKSSDINAAQSELRRNLLDYLYRAYATSNGAASLLTTVQTGFVGRSFAVEASTPTSMVVNIAPGMGFSTGAQDANVNGIVGLNDLSVYKPIYLSATKQVTVPTAPGAGFCRRDAIYVHISRQLTDATASDVYNVASGLFASQTINKTMTFDLVNQTVQYIEPGSGDTWTSAIVYAKGANTAYTTEDDLLNAPITSAPAFQGWFRIAVINLYPNATSINDGHIADWRFVLAPNGLHEFVGSATLGGGVISAIPALAHSATISALTLRTPAGARACLSHPYDVVNGTHNEYTLSVIGLSNATKIAGYFSTANTLSKEGDANYGVPVMCAQISRNTNVLVTSAIRSQFLAANQTYPQMLVAIGQPIQQLQFALGWLAQTATDNQFVTGSAHYTGASSINNDTIDVSFNIKVTV